MENQNCNHSLSPARGEGQGRGASAINHPSHYQGKVECIDAMLSLFGEDAVEHFCRINAFKYLWRAGEKEGNSKEQDEAKARWYLAKLHEIVKKRNNIRRSEEEDAQIIEKNLIFYKQKIKDLKYNS